MANVKVPALLHKMSKAAQKAWYKKNNMTMPSEVEGGGRSAAAAKRVVAPAPRKQMAAAPQSVRAMNTARQQAYYAKGGRQPIGAGGSGGSSSMAGVGQSSAKEIIKGIKAGYNPKVALVRYTNEEVEQVDEVTKKEAEETLGGPVKTKPKMPPGKQPEGYRYVRALARRAMKAGLKKEEVEQVDEARRMSAAEKLGRAFDSEQQRSALSRQRGLDLLKQKDTEKMQNKLASGNMTKLKKEETEESTMKYIEEKLTAADPASKWISDFVKSDNPKFAGKSKKERIQQALGAYYAKKRGTNEEVETVDEGRLRRSMRGYAVLGGYGYGNKVRYQSAGERSREINVGLDDKQEKENARRAAGADKAKMKKEEADQIDELKKSTLASYVGKAAGRLAAASRLQKDFEKDGHTALAGEFEKSAQKKKVGIQKAANKLAKEEAEQIDEISPGLARKAAAASQVKAIEFSDYSGLSNLHNKEGKKEANRLNRKSDKAMDYIGKRQGQKGVDKVNRMVTRVVGEEVVTEAEGKVAVTPKEKSLAAHHGDKTKITFGDVLKARLKSAAAKKMGK